MAYVAVRGYRIGEGRPKVILPIIEPTEAQILSRGAEFSTLRADCVEWRLDHWASLSIVQHCCAVFRGCGR